LWGSAGIGVAVGAGIGGVAVIATALILFTLTPLKRLEARLEPRDVVDDLVISLRDDKRAVGKTLDALERLGVRVRRATVEPGAGATAILSVNLAQPLRTDQMAQLARRLLSLKYIERVETLAYHVEDEVNLRMDGAGEAPTRGEQAALNLSDDRALDGLDDDRRAVAGARDASTECDGALEGLDDDRRAAAGARDASSECDGALDGLDDDHLQKASPLEE
jgi:hypothetical protein